MSKKASKKGGILEFSLETVKVIPNVQRKFSSQYDALLEAIQAKESGKFELKVSGKKARDIRSSIGKRVKAMGWEMKTRGNKLFIEK